MLVARLGFVALVQVRCTVGHVGMECVVCCKGDWRTVLRLENSVQLDQLESFEQLEVAHKANSKLRSN